MVIVEKVMSTKSEAQVSALTEIVRHRRSIRQFAERSVPPDMLHLCLFSAHCAPSAHNRQPWRFVAVSDEQFKHSLADRMGGRLLGDLRADGVSEEVAVRDANRSRARITSAPVVLVMCLTMADMDRYPDQSRQ